MAQKPPIGKDAAGVADEAFKVRTEIDLDAFYQRLVNETRRLMTDLSQRGLAGDALADAVAEGLRGLSDKPIVQMGRSSTSEAFNLGRNIAAQQNTLLLGTAVRSEILDDNTCENCEKLDGAVVEINGPVIEIKPKGADLLRENGIDPDSPNAYFALMPPNFCNGLDLCRGLFYYRRAA